MEQRDTRTGRILVVDDDVGNCRALERILRRNGYRECSFATDPRHVLSLVASFRPDLLVTDLHMPHLDGFQVMEQVRSRLEPQEYFPILVLSGDLSREARQRALRSGGRDFLAKPFDDDEVTLRIGNLLETRFLYDAVRDQNRELDEKVRTRTAELERAQADTLDRLARAAEFRDDQTGEHTHRVGELTARVGQALGLAPEQVEILRRAAPLHDVGKIGTPDRVLLKPGALDAEEREVMKAHTVIGARILAGSRSPLLHEAEEIALYHHERWNGTGYASLAGETIPLSARIVAVVDVFDALTHERPYKKAWSVADALEEIRSQAGVHFDPRVAEAFLGVLNSPGPAYAPRCETAPGAPRPGSPWAIAAVAAGA
ncbi:MAG: response regulator [Deltaproteobacteria bacterium]|nr:response regulator [Deltaproteobacteria bacterium]